MAKFSIETKKEIAALYADKSNKTTDIAKKYGISSGYVKAVAVDQMGCEPRHEKHIYKRAQNKKCPNCRGKIDVKGAKFCPFCGADIRSERDLLIEKLNKLSAVLLMLPAGERDGARDIIIDVRKYLLKEGNND